MFDFLKRFVAAIAAELGKAPQSAFQTWAGL